MSTFSESDLERARRYGQVTPNGVAYDWWPVSSDHAGVALYREPHHTDADIQTARNYLNNEGDVVSMSIYKPRKT